jgi:hypothetical protein
MVLLWKVLAVGIAVAVMFFPFVSRRLEREHSHNAYTFGLWSGVLAFMAVASAFGWCGR